MKTLKEELTEFYYWADQNIRSYDIVPWKVDEYLRLYRSNVEDDVNNNAVAICPKCGAEETAFDTTIDKSKCIICQHTW